MPQGTHFLLFVDLLHSRYEILRNSFLARTLAGLVAVGKLTRLMGRSGT